MFFFSVKGVKYLSERHTQPNRDPQNKRGKERKNCASQMAKPVADWQSNKEAVQATNDDASASKLYLSLSLYPLPNYPSFSTLILHIYIFATKPNKT